MDAAFESVFAFLFKYRPFVFEKGTVALGVAWPGLVLALGGGVAAITVYLYLRSPGKLHPADRGVLTVLRLGVVGLLTFVLLRPLLVVASVVPQQNFLAIVVDDSRSMQVADADGRARAAVVKEMFGAEGGDVARALADRFKLRFFRFDGATERVEAVDGLAFAGTRTAVGQALEHARQELSAVPLAGMVLVSDGADNSDAALTEPLLRLKASGLPVYTVGVGRERFSKDIALGRVETPRRVLKGSTLVVELYIGHSGFGGQTVPVQVESDGRIVSTEQVVLPRGGETATVPVQFPADEAGPRLFRFHVPPQPGELVKENNTREALIIVEGGRQKILYFEGEPRFEFKFVRRAVADDQNLQVVGFMRMAENNYGRYQVESPDELAAGFPSTREELFGYHGLILGSVEASFFTQDQLRMIGEFVSQRGGGLLMLGGRHAFAQGGYGETAVADALPVVIPPLDPVDGSPSATEIKVEPTPVGVSHPATQIATTLEASADRWEALPPLTTVTPIRDVKPGASTLLSGTATTADDRVVVLAAQRYGRGRSLALPIQDSWLWQMHAEIPIDDPTHERFWQQLLRWLVSGAPDRVMVMPSEDRVGLGRSVTLAAEVSDSAYLRLNGAEVRARLTSPSGVERDLTLEWAVDEDGRYEVDFVADERGLYSFTVEAGTRDGVVGDNRGYVYAADPTDEFFESELRAETLQRIAEETGGRYYTQRTLGGLPEDVQYTESGTTVREEKDLWDMPVVFFLLVTLLAAEWGYRRLRGLV